jgi:IS4 transposase
MSQSTPSPLEHSTALTDRNTLEFTVQLLTQHFDVQADGYRCQTRDLWQVLVAAAAQGSTIEATCHDLCEAPDSNPIRAYLNDQVTTEQVRPLEANFNRALSSPLPRWFQRQLRHKGVHLAIDLHDVPYYGKAEQRHPDDHWVCRGEAQVGTTRFYRCATAYVMQRDVRWSLAVTFVQPCDSQVAIVQRLIKQVRTLGLRRGCLYLDKAFCSVPVLGYLQEQTPFAAIVAAPLRGKVGSGRGTRALCQGRASYFTHYTFNSPEHGALRVPVAVVRTLCRRRNGTCQAQWLVYVVLRLRPGKRQRTERVIQVRQRYRLRFGIESSRPTGYRLLEQVRLRTTSPNEALRFFCIGLALLLGSVWIALHWRYLQVRGSGPRRVAREHFSLERMTNFLRHAVEAIYGVVLLVHPPNVKPVIY